MILRQCFFGCVAFRTSVSQTVCFIFNENGENKIFMTDRFKSLLYQPED